jgi:hypothetical protein
LMPRRPRLIGIAAGLADGLADHTPLPWRMGRATVAVSDRPLSRPRFYMKVDVDLHQAGSST